jgi:Mlc titration factor MtfA (ptsG expression regulator)
MLGSLRAWRRKHVLRNTRLDDGLWQRVAERFGFVLRLDDAEKARLRELCILLLHEKQFSAAGDFELTDQMKLGIAIQACILVLNLDLDYYRNWVEIIVYPDEFVPRHEFRNEHGLVETDHRAFAGQAWFRGPVILSWANVESAWTGGEGNVVIHEFAHKLDMLNGSANGFPRLHRDMNRQQWSRVFTDAYADFCRRVQSDEPTEITAYASESPAEFFAVASESFFELPDVLDRIYPLVYAQLVMYYRQNPLSRELPREWRLHQ